MEDITINNILRIFVFSDYLGTIRLRATCRFFNLVYHTYYNKIWRRKLRLHFPQHGLIGEPRSHYVLLTTKRGTSYWVPNYDFPNNKIVLHRSQFDGPPSFVITGNRRATGSPIWILLLNKTFRGFVSVNMVSDFCRRWWCKLFAKYGPPNRLLVGTLVVVEFAEMLEHLSPVDNKRITICYTNKVFTLVFGCFNLP